MRIAALSLSPLLDSYQRLAACCAAQETAAPDDLDSMLGNLEHVLAAFIHQGDGRSGRRAGMLIVRLQARAPSTAVLMTA